ncbi:hypothetical protein FHG87_013542 [Trinorchestia longiramus]|nr:hypothetical protein FHG87_013542 [Trinorchestia longiramus]
MRELPTNPHPSSNTSFNQSTCPTDPPDGDVYITTLKTKNAKVENQQMMCRTEGDGVPYVIKTEEQREAAVEVLKNEDEEKAWLTVTKSWGFLSFNILWVDGSLVNFCAFPNELRDFSYVGDRFVLTKSSKLQSIGNGFWSTNAEEAPVLCLKAQSK